MPSIGTLAIHRDFEMSRFDSITFNEVRRDARSQAYRKHFYPWYCPSALMHEPTLKGLPKPALGRIRRQPISYPVWLAVDYKTHIQLCMKNPQHRTVPFYAGISAKLSVPNTEYAQTSSLREGSQCHAVRCKPHDGDLRVYCCRHALMLPPDIGSELGQSPIGRLHMIYEGIHTYPRPALGLAVAWAEMTPNSSCSVSR
ncbi:hypothetical protein K445DRAFT_367588 [Daldinia sp. EC12]|nr:hypothetical protein K445DRAFT_367588 [Daldinia sp. EC12]